MERMVGAGEPLTTAITNETLDSIFTKAISHRPLFLNHNALQSDYVPEHLPFRAQQITSVGQVLAPILRHSRPSNLLIYGKTGTGKTAVTRHVISRLEDRCRREQIPSCFTYCNTRLSGTEYRTLGELATGVGLKIPFTGLALTEVLSRIQQHVSENSLKILLVLDEIDYLVRAYGDDLIYGLTTSDKVEPGTISLVGISNDLKFKEDLGARVLSRLSEEELVFPPYSAEELKSILSERAKMAFRSGTYSEAAVNLCAALSGSEHGDARRAVDLLRVAGEVAEREGVARLEERHVKLALQKIDQDRILEALRTLPFHAKLVLLAVILPYPSTEQRKLSSGVVFDAYSSLCKKSSVEPLTARRVSGLLTELDTLGLVSATLVNYGRHGRTKNITSQVGLDTISNVFAEDNTVNHLLPT